MCFQKIEKQLELDFDDYLANYMIPKRFKSSKCFKFGVFTVSANNFTSYIKSSHILKIFEITVYIVPF